jgi:CRISPR-associated protein Cas2
VQQGHLMFWIVSYDIRDNKRRYQVMKLLEGYGRRAQFSVFECDISLDQLQRLKSNMEILIHDKEDDVRFYPLNEADVAKIHLLGKARLQRARLFYMV